MTYFSEQNGQPKIWVGLVIAAAMAVAGFLAIALGRLLGGLVLLALAITAAVIVYRAYLDRKSN